MSNVGFIKERDLTTRAGLVSAIAGGWKQPEGHVINVAGLDYAFQAAATAIADLPGLAPSGDISAGHFGFSAANGTAADNAVAIAAAVTYAAGRKVIVDTPVDWQCSYLQMTSQHVNVEFQGPGWKQGGVWNVANAYDRIQSVSSLTNGTLTLQGSSSRAAVIVVADASQYARNDVMRIVSDDIFPDARLGYTARYGEDFTVTYVDIATNSIYVTGRLEFFSKYVTNIRVARLPKYTVDIKGLRVKGNGNTNRLLTIGPHFRPKVNDCVFDQCSYNAFGSDGNIEASFTNITADFVLTGDYGTLSYGVFEGQGARNKYVGLKSFGARHGFTTGCTSVDAGSVDIHNFGPPRDNVVIDGCCTSNTNSPWDDHEGAIRTTFVRCTARAPHRGGGASFTAYQARGRDMRIVDCDTSEGFAAVLLNHNVGFGEHIIEGGNHRCPVVDYNDPDGVNYADVLVSNVTARLPVGPSLAIMFNSLSKLTIRGGHFHYDLADDTNRRFIDAFAGQAILCGNPVFSTSGVSTKFRFANLKNAAWLTGGIILDIGHTGTPGPLVQADLNAVAMDLTVQLIRGPVPAMTVVSGGGTFSWISWKLLNDTGVVRAVTELNSSVWYAADGVTEIGRFNPATGALTAGHATFGSAGIGYKQGETVSQASNKSTAVAMTRASGQITMNAASLAAGASVTFRINNTLIAVTDNILVQPRSPFAGYRIDAQIGAGFADITVTNTTAGALAEAVFLNVNLSKGSTTT